MRRRTLITLVLLIWWAGAVSAQSRDRPVDLRVTGMLLAVEEAKRDDLVTINARKCAKRRCCCARCASVGRRP